MAKRKQTTLHLQDDPYLAPFREAIRKRKENAENLEKRLTEGKMSLKDFASGHEYFGLHRGKNGWIFREWAPNAERIFLVGDFSDWLESPEFSLKRIDPSGNWEIKLPLKTLKHGNLYRLNIHWPDGMGERLPAYTRRVVQDETTKIFNAQVWAPKSPYQWKYSSPKKKTVSPLIYEAHIGMAQDREGIGTWEEFRRNIIPRIVDAGYNTIQLMAVMEHPYYGSFGYHVTNYFAASSRFGTPEELKALIDEAHKAGLIVIMDLVHSHSANNENEGLSRFDGTLYQYFHKGGRGLHSAWDSRCFDYGKPEVLHFLLSNCRFWLDEYHLDGFRFDGVTSMLYFDHGLGKAFCSYDDYFDSSRVDEDALCYLTLANKVIHNVKPDAMTVAEDVSGIPGLGAPIDDGGIGFDYRLAMGIPDFWFKMLKDVSDENWNMETLWHELTNRRRDEKTISYTESHDQSIVGGKTVIFELIDADMYGYMDKSGSSITVDRGLSLHKMIRLATLTTAGHGYLNFIGNEFGHPEWVDFPREGNNWSYKYARRQWHLRDDPNLKYHFLADFDREMLKCVKKAKLLQSIPNLLYIHCDDQVLAYERNNLILIFNFNPTISITDYFIDVNPGKYVHLMDSDESRFGGQDRIEKPQVYFTQSINHRHCIQIYLPCRSALVLRYTGRKK